MALPTRTPNTMSDAIAICSPNGRMSKRSQEAALRRLHDSIFGTEPYSLTGEDETPVHVRKAGSLRRAAKDLRDLAAKGMQPRKFLKKAFQLEAEANALLET